ncbi:MAG: ankyrin repeat domain-containing protein [Novosphingobium sp.]|nr:ankyrin repeat domain-containing protein [Novosphingobium sp.]
MLLPLLVGSLAMTSPAQAQFSQGFKFLEAVKKKDGVKVEEAINEPGSTVVNTRDVTSGETALHIVTARRDLTWMTYLIQKGANVNARDGKGVTPLQLATNLGFLEGVELLVARDADLDESNDAGETPLISAVHRRDIAMLRVLLKGGADPDRADNSGRSARDYATLAGRNSPLLAEIEANAKPKEQQAGSQAVYGPTF